MIYSSSPDKQDIGDKFEYDLEGKEITQNDSAADHLFQEEKENSDEQSSGEFNIEDDMQDKTIHKLS